MIRSPLRQNVAGEILIHFLDAVKFLQKSGDSQRKRQYNINKSKLLIESRKDVFV